MCPWDGRVVDAAMWVGSIGWTRPMPAAGVIQAKALASSLAAQFFPVALFPRPASILAGEPQAGEYPSAVHNGGDAETFVFQRECRGRFAPVTDRALEA